MATNRVTTYSADEVTLSIAGLLIDSGYADGEFVSVEPASDDFIAKTGADGEVARAKSNNRGATVKIKLLQTSLGNNLLSQLRALDLAAPNGAGVGVFNLVDRSSGVTLVHGTHSWIQKAPSPTRAREITENEWTLYIAFADIDPSGSPSLP